ncbi:UDP-N-acetylglucosamine--undecaprenyl-phosphate N-acetylglucosaminephosphotransferase [Enterovibrio sp. Hal110]
MTMYTPYIGAFALSFISLYLFRKLAYRIGLVDIPTGRKQHQGAVPLVGGLTLFSVVSTYLIFFVPFYPASVVFMASIALLTLIGVLDDKYDVSYKLRFFIQILLGIVMIAAVDVELEFLGNMFGLGALNLGFLSYPITILAVVGAINAFNMVDGIDGLLGGLSIVTFGALAYFFSTSGVWDLVQLCLVVIAALVPYIMMNLGIFGKKRKVFMGDSGSMIIGFMALWLIIKASQPNFEAAMRPVTALWIIALPLMDMAAIMIRRLRRGDSPFKPDREHLHHICQRAGLNPTQTLAAICALALIFATFGIVGENTNIPEYIMCIAFVGTFGLYFLALSHIWRLLTFVRRLFGKEALVYQNES